MTRITAPNGRFWEAPGPEGEELLRVAADVARTAGAAAALRAARAEQELALDDAEPGWSIAAALRTALAIICARLLRDESRAPETLAYRDRLYELDGLLQTVLAPRRRGQYATFPSRRHMRRFAQMGFPVEEVARVIGMPLDEAAADGVVAMILGLHI